MFSNLVCIGVVSETLVGIGYTGIVYGENILMCMWGVESKNMNPTSARPFLCSARDEVLDHKDPDEHQSREYACPWVAVMTK